MPANTPNRGYPYPVPSDSGNVPQDMENLANAIDADLTTVSNDIVPRPIFRVFSSTSFTFPVFVASSFVLPFDLIDLNSSGAFEPNPSGQNNSITPLLPGFWWLTATCSYARPAALPAPNFDEFGISIQSGSTVFAKRNTHSEPVTGENRSLSVGTGVFLDGNTPIQAVFTANRITSVPFYTVYNRSFTGFRMTES